MSSFKDWVCEKMVFLFLLVRCFSKTQKEHLVPFMPPNVIPNLYQSPIYVYLHFIHFIFLKKKPVSCMVSHFDDFFYFRAFWKQITADSDLLSSGKPIFRAKRNSTDQRWKFHFWTALLQRNSPLNRSETVLIQSTHSEAALICAESYEKCETTLLSANLLWNFKPCYFFLLKPVQLLNASCWCKSISELSLHLFRQ